MPKKPHDAFPLFKHATGRWCKKVRGKHEYFGPIEGDERGEAAILRWLDWKDDLLAGRRPRPKSNAVTMKHLSDHFLTFKEQLRDNGELATRTFDRLYIACEVACQFFGTSRQVDDLRPEDFQALRAKMSQTLGPVALGNEIGMIRSLFKYGWESRLLPAPIQFGPAFKKPSPKSIRMLRIERGPRMFSAKEIKAIIKVGCPNAKAITLLAINGGLGNTDLGLLPKSLPDLKKGWLDYPRSKTAINRRIPLWPETIAAIKEVLRTRIVSRHERENELLFTGVEGRIKGEVHRGRRIGDMFAIALKDAGVKNRTFYDLRRTFQTIAEDAHDLVAVQSIMGHAPSSGDMSAVYRQAVSDDRLRAVTDHVRKWLFKR